MCSKRCWLASWSVDTSVLVGLSVAHATSLVVVAAAVNTVDVKKTSCQSFEICATALSGAAAQTTQAVQTALKLCRRVVPSITPAASLASGRITSHITLSIPAQSWPGFGTSGCGPAQSPPRCTTHQRPMYQLYLVIYLVGHLLIRQRMMITGGLSARQILKHPRKSRSEWFVTFVELI